MILEKIIIDSEIYKLEVNGLLQRQKEKRMTDYQRLSPS